MGKQQATVLRWGIVLAGAVIGLLFQVRRGEGQVPWCPIQGCGDKVATSCGVCKTINGNYAVYKSGKE